MNKQAEQTTEQTTELVEVMIYNLWTNTQEAVKMHKKDAEEFQQISDPRCRIALPPHLTPARHFYVLCAEVKEGITEAHIAEHGIRGDDLGDVALIRKDVVESLGISYMEQPIVLLATGALQATKLDKNFEAQKRWETPVYIFRDEPMPEGKWEAWCELMAKHAKLSSITAMLEGIFGEIGNAVNKEEEAANGESAK